MPRRPCEFPERLIRIRGPGTARLDQVEENVTASGVKLSQETLRALESVLRPSPEQ